LHAHLINGELGLGRQRMVQSFVLILIDVIHRAEGPLVQLLFRPLIDHCAAIAGKGRTILYALKKILPQFRADLLEEKPQMGEDGVIAQDGVAGLQDIMQAEPGNAGKYKHDAQKQPTMIGREWQARSPRHRYEKRDDECCKARLEDLTQDIHRGGPSLWLHLERNCLQQG
jgi:hypothetical protein